MSYADTVENKSIDLMYMQYISFENRQYFFTTVQSIATRYIFSRLFPSFKLQK